jgi:hypothetical protein
MLQRAATGGAVLAFLTRLAPVTDAGSCIGLDDTWSLEEDLYVVDEDAGTLVIGITRTGVSPDCDADIEYQTLAGSATSGQDYEPTSGTLHWDEFDYATKTFEIVIFDNGQAEGVESFQVQISAQDQENVGPITLADVRIQDDDPAATTVTVTTTTTITTTVHIDGPTVTTGPSATQTVTTTTTVQESPLPLAVVLVALAAAFVAARRRL